MDRYLEIDFKKLNNNLDKIKKFSKDKHIMAIIKGNAYGLGLINIAQELQDRVEYFGVGLEYEAVKLRENNITTPILILSPYFSIENIIKYNITPSIDNITDLKYLNEEAEKLGIEVPFHLKLNTGMNRFGLNVSDVEDFIEIYKRMNNVSLEGVFSHFAITSDRNANFVNKQISKFKKIMTMIEDNNISVKYVHMENSNALFTINSSYFNMARVGSGLYGKVETDKLNLRQVSALKAKVIDIREIGKNQYVGYGLGYKTKKNTKVAIIPIGFSDGYEVIREQKSYSIIELFTNIIKLPYRYIRERKLVYFEGKPLKTIGKPNMQFVLIDITESQSVSLGDIVEIKVPAFFVSNDLPRVYKNAKNTKNSEIEVVR